MKFMVVQLFVRGCQQCLLLCLCFVVVELGQMCFYLVVFGNNICYCVVFVVGDFQGCVQVYQVVVFGVDCYFVLVCCVKLCQYFVVSGQFGCMQFWIVVVELDYLVGWQLVIVQWVKVYYFYVVVCQQCQVIEVIKIEGFIVGEGQCQFFVGIGGKLFFLFVDWYGGQFVEGQQLVYVEGVFQQVGKILLCLLIDY